MRRFIPLFGPLRVRPLIISTYEARWPGPHFVWVTMRQGYHKNNWPLIAAVVVFLLYLADILVAKFQFAAGNSTAAFVGDTGQFLLLLLAVILFVIGTLVEERHTQKHTKPDDENHAAADAE